MTRPALGIIGGTVLTELADLTQAQDREVQTPFGAPSGPLRWGRLADRDVVFVFRHGSGHRLAPHAVNYRANIHALAQAGVKKVIATAAVGGIGAAMYPGRVVLPDQLIDYSWGRAHSFCGDAGPLLQHIEFTQPYDRDLRAALAAGGQAGKIDFVARGVHGITQGPRLETAAEIERMARDGCDIVGMTGMPEAALAREAGLAYACCAVVVNWAAGRGSQAIHAQIETHIEQGGALLGQLLAHVIPRL